MEKIQAAIAKARAEREGKIERGEIPDAPEKRIQAPPAMAPTAVAPAAADPQPTAQPDEQPNVSPAPDQQSDVVYTTPSISPDVIASWEELQSFEPKPQHMARERIIGFEDGPASTPIDMLRSKVLRQMRANNWRRLAITSPGSNCGKSTVAMNLAFSFSRQAELRTIVCDMDLQKPSLAGILGIKTQLSFAKVLAGDSYFRAEAVRVQSNLAFGLTQTGVRNSAELLQGPLVAPALSEIEYHFAPDIMIFDMPAMLTSDHTTAFLGHVDCVLMVVGAGSSTLREVDICEADLAEQSNMIGTVLNKCRYMDRDFA